MKNFLFLIAVTLVIAGCSNDKQEEIIEQTTRGHRTNRLNFEH